MPPGATGGEALRALLATPPAYAVVDTIPVPLMRRGRGDRHHCFGVAAAVGRGGSDREWYYGLSLLTVGQQGGIISGFVLGPASTDGRWLAEALLRWRQDPAAAAPTLAELTPVLGPPKDGRQRRGPSGPLGPRAAVGTPSPQPYLGDLGCAGGAWQAHWRACYGATVLTKADYAAAAPAERASAEQWLCSLRQVIETVGAVLCDLLGLKFPRARTYWGLLTRLAAKIAACNLLLYLNHLYARPTFAYASPLI